jgi:hypothetical protein
MMNRYNPIVVFLSLITLVLSHVTPVDNFGPQAAVAWSLPSGQFTALQFTLLIPPTLPWTNLFFDTYFQSSLSNSADFTWSYLSDITYQNLSGPANIPPYYDLTFQPTSSISGPAATVEKVNVYPGDTITVGLSKSGATWNQKWSVVRGATGKAAGSSASSGTFAYTFPATATFDTAELGAFFISTFWDFGPITWSNIKLTASTTSTSWCTSTPLSVYTPAVNATYPNGLSVGSVSGASSTCTLPTMIWAQPPGALAAEAAYKIQVANCDRIMSEGGVCTY